GGRGGRGGGGGVGCRGGGAVKGGSGLSKARGLGGGRLRINLAADRRRAEGPRPPRPFGGPPGPGIGSGGGGGPMGGNSWMPRGKPFKTKGSRPGLRGPKRSL